MSQVSVTLPAVINPESQVRDFSKAQFFNLQVVFDSLGQCGRVDLTKHFFICESYSYLNQLEIAWIIIHAK